MTMQEQKSFCRLCLCMCGVVTQKDDSGRLVSIRGDHDHAVTSGYACLTGLQSPAAHNSPDRILHPLKRMPDGSFARIPLEQALDEIAEKLRGIIDIGGARAVAGYRGTANYQNIAAAALLPEWLRVIGSPAFFSTMTVDQSAKWVSVERLGMWAAGRDNFDDSDVSLLVGTNPLVSGTTLGFPCTNPVKTIKAARARGLKLIVIDPRLSETAKLADIFLQPMPGEDASIAAGLLRIILNEGWEDKEFCDRYVNGLEALRTSVEPFTPAYVEQRSGVPRAKLYEAAKAFAYDAKRGFAVTGTGPNMGPHSNLAEHLIECLNVVCGRFRRAGDKVVNPVFLGPKVDRFAQVIPPGRSWEKGYKSRIRDTGMIFGEMMTCILADEILLPGDGQIRSLFVVGGNPVGALPDPRKTVQAFKSLDLLVSVEPFMTDTAKLSHYILPPKLQYERPDCTGIHDLVPQPFAQYTPAIVHAPDGADVADEWYVFWALAKRLGLTLNLNGEAMDMETPPSTEAVLAHIMRHAQTPLDEVLNAPAGVFYGDHTQYVQPAAPGADARFEVCPPDVADEIADVLAAPPPPEDFTHRLSVRRMRGVINTAYRDLPEIKRRKAYNPAFLHPDDIRSAGLHSGDRIQIESAYGRIPAIVEADETLRPGVVSMTHGWGAVLEGESADYEMHGASTSFLVSADENLESINSMVRLTGVPVNILPG